MQDVIGLGLFSFVTGSLAFERCSEHNNFSDVVSLFAWIVLPLATICFLLAEHARTDLTTTLVVLNLFVVSFYASFLRHRLG